MFICSFGCCVTLVCISLCKHLPALTITKWSPSWILPASAGGAGEMGSIPGSGCSPREGNEIYSSVFTCGNPMDTEPGGLSPHRVSMQSQTQNWATEHAVHTLLFLTPYFFTLSEETDCLSWEFCVIGIWNNLRQHVTHSRCSVFLNELL